MTQFLPEALAGRAKGPARAVAGIMLLLLVSLPTLVFAAAGDLDPTFGLVVTDFGSEEDAGEFAILPDGKLLVVGAAGSVRGFLVRYNSDGSLDQTFGDNGRTHSQLQGCVSTEYNELAIQSDQKIVVAGVVLCESARSNDVVLARHNEDGSLDRSFGNDGWVVTDLAGSHDRVGELAILPDGKLLVVGTAHSGEHNRVALARYNSDGSPDMTFDGDGRAFAGVDGYQYSNGEALALQPDGKLITAGWVSDENPRGFLLARFNGDGTLDTTFGTGGVTVVDFGGAGGSAWSIAIQADGTIIAAGNKNSPDGPDFALARFDAEGRLDPSFGDAGTVTTNIELGDTIFDLTIQPDGKLVVAGSTGYSGYHYTGRSATVARYTADGLLDPTFGQAGIRVLEIPNKEYALALDANLQPDGKLVVGGGAWDPCRSCFNTGDIWLARLETGLERPPGSWTISLPLVAASD